MIDRATGTISQLNLPDLDPGFSVSRWYHDYAAYCGLSKDGKKLCAVVAQVGGRKAILRKALGASAGDDP